MVKQIVLPVKYFTYSTTEKTIQRDLRVCFSIRFYSLQYTSVVLRVLSI